MKIKWSESLPSPGSNDAVEAGCTCPILDNAHGGGFPGKEGSVMYWVAQGCRLHGQAHKENDLHPMNVCQSCGESKHMCACIAELEAAAAAEEGE